MATGTINKPLVNVRYGSFNATVAATSIESYTVTFDPPFPTGSSPHVQLTMFSNSTAVGGGAFVGATVSTTPTATGFTVKVFNGDSAQRQPAIYWLAILK